MDWDVLPNIVRKLPLSRVPCQKLSLGRPLSAFRFLHQKM